MATPSNERKRVRDQIDLEGEPATVTASLGDIGDLNLLGKQQQLENVAVPENLEGEIRPSKRRRFELGSPENPVLLDEDEGDEESSVENRSELINCVQNEENKVVPMQADEEKALDITVIQSDEEEVTAAVTEQKSVSRRVKKKAVVETVAAEEEATPRRVSPRLQAKPESEKPVYFPPARILKSKLGENREGLEDPDCYETARDRVTRSDGAEQSDMAGPALGAVLALTAADMLNPAAAATVARPGGNSRNVERNHGNNRDGSNDKEEKADGAGNSVSRATRSRAAAAGKRTNGNAAEIAVEEGDAAARVKDTLRIFNGWLLHFAKEEEERCKEKRALKQELETAAKVANKTNGEKGSKNGEKASKNPKSIKGEHHLVEMEGTKKSSKRPDLKAANKMRETNTILYPTKRFGHIPGVNVGDHFFSRCELVAIGLHCHWLNGIDYMGKSYSKMEEYKGYIFPLAVAIVLSGKYEDDLDKSENVIYTGQGGNDLLGNKRQFKDQQMERGNEALKNSMDQKTPVRVIRGHDSKLSYTKRVYTYDGLYKVTKYWAEKGLSGFTVFKFCLERIEGQPVLTTDQVHFSRAQIPDSASDLRGLVCRDISNGLEKIPIPASNVVDIPPFPPTGYTYLKSNKIAEGVHIPPPAKGCDCKRECIDPKKCSCARLNGNEFPYVGMHGGRLVHAKSVVYECGPNCGCGPSCVNRTSQQGLKYRLEVFRTPNKGWAVRSWDSIPAGASVCEYTGILMRTDELDNVSDNNFIFEIDCLQTMKGIDGRQRRLGDVSKHDDITTDKLDDKKDGQDVQPEFCIDAGTCGGVARFINHSCDPNLFVQCVLSLHHDPRLARVLLCAADNIHPLQELTYDYGYALDSVVDEHGRIMQMPCYCGAIDCRKRLY